LASLRDGLPRWQAGLTPRREGAKMTEMIRPFIKPDVVLSSRIEGTVMRLDQLLLFEAQGDQGPDEAAEMMLRSVAEPGVPPQSFAPWRLCVMLGGSGRKDSAKAQRVSGGGRIERRG
jgi:hypothetical protein